MTDKETWRLNTVVYDLENRLTKISMNIEEQRSVIQELEEKKQALYLEGEENPARRPDILCDIKHLASQISRERGKLSVSCDMREITAVDLDVVEQDLIFARGYSLEDLEALQDKHKYWSVYYEGLLEVLQSTQTTVSPPPRTRITDATIITDAATKEILEAWKKHDQEKMKDGSTKKERIASPILVEP